MKAVILCAGKGKRLDPLTRRLPKAMVSIAGKPLLQLSIEHLCKFGITDFYINLHHLPKIITDYFGDGGKFGVRITYSHETKLLGTGGALLNFRKYLEKRFILLYGDIYTMVNFTAMEKFHVYNKSLITIAVHPSDHEKDSDLVQMDSFCKATRFFFKPHKQDFPPGCLGIAAVYIVEPKALRHLPEFSPFHFDRDFLPILLEKNKRLFCYNTDELIKDIGTFDRLKWIKKFYDYC